MKDAGFLLTFMLCAALVGCGDAGDGSNDGTSPSSTPFEELYAQGVDRYLGAFTPVMSRPAGDGVVTHTFRGDEGGPVCFTGSEFAMSTRDGSRDELMIFLQGGGACGSTNCDAVDQAPPGIPPLGILSAADPDNPTLDWDVGYVPYCDGSLYMGDREVDVDGDGTVDRSYRGPQNLSAALDVIAENYPSPSRILLAGNSGGGFGVHVALPLVRALYPDVAIEVVNDSGVGVLAPGVLETEIEFWGAEAVFPASCTECIGDDGHLTGYHEYQLDEDDNIRMGFMSTMQDEVIADEFLGIGGPAFEAALIPAMAELKEAHPERFNSMIAEGNGHTFILRDFDREVADTSPRQWVVDMLSGGDAWDSVTD